MPRPRTALLVAALRVVADEFEEERNVVSFALGANAFNERVLDVVHISRGVRGVIEQNLDGIRAHFLDPLYGQVGEKIGHAVLVRGIVAGFFVGQQQAGVCGAGGGGADTTWESG